MHLLDTEHRGQGGGLAGEDEVEDGPGALQGVDKEELEGGGDGAGGDVLLVDEEEEVSTELIRGDQVGRLAVVAGELLDGLDVTDLRAGGEAAELHVLEHALA